MFLRPSADACTRQSNTTRALRVVLTSEALRQVPRTRRSVDFSSAGVKLCVTSLSCSNCVALARAGLSTDHLLNCMLSHKSSDLWTTAALALWKQGAGALSNTQSASLLRRRGGRQPPFGPAANYSCNAKTDRHPSSASSSCCQRRPAATGAQHEITFAHGWGAPGVGLPALDVKVDAAGASYPSLGDDESYKLRSRPRADAQSADGWARCGASSVLAIVTYEFDTATYRSTVYDSGRPAAPHRGLMVDSGRHFLSVATLLHRGLAALRETGVLYRT